MTVWFVYAPVAGVNEASGVPIAIPLWVTMSSVPEERAAIDHVAVEKSEFKMIDWGTNFVV